MSAAAQATRGGVVIWFTGLSGSGKSTLAGALEAELHRRGGAAVVLDGDVVRSGLSADLGFSAHDRGENVRRVADVAKLVADAGVVAIVALISPFARDRARARAVVGGAFVEVYLSAPLDACEARDPKGLYARARRGEIAEFTGISSPYEPPLGAELVIDTSTVDVAGALARILDRLDRTGPG